MANGLTTRSLFLTVVTSEPVSSTTPMNSCPIRAGSPADGIEPYGHRSLPQMQEAVTRTSASVGNLITESGTSSTRTSPAPYMVVARIRGSPIGSGSGGGKRRGGALEDGNGDGGDERQEAGLKVFGQRRVPGLRREEVAPLAGLSVDYYNRLERGNLGGASDSVL